MNTNRLSDTLCKVLNAQITQEAHSAQIYLSYASWAHIFEVIINLGAKAVTYLWARHVLRCCALGKSAFSFSFYKPE